MFMKTSYKIMAVTLGMSLLAGCSSGGETQTAKTSSNETSVTETKQKSDGEKVTLKTVSMFGATDPALQVYNQTLEEFKGKYPNVEIVDESSASNEEWKARIKADFAVGNEPDVILYFTDANSHALIENGSFVDIATIRGVYPEFTNHIFEHAYTTAPDGKQYAVPTRGFYEALFCNKDLFDQYNLELPTDWEKLTKAVETFNANGVVPFAVSFSDIPHYMIEHLVMAAGGVEEHKAVPASIEEIPKSWITAMDQLPILNKAGAFPVDVNATTDALTSEMFYSKQAAMKIDGSWFMGGIADKENVVAMPFPSIEKDNSKDIVAGFTSGWYITQKAWDDESKRQACVDFIEMVSTPEFLGKITTVAPCELPAPKDMTLLDQTGWDTFVNAGDRVDLPIDSRISGEAWSTWLTSVGHMAEGSITSQEVLDNVITIYNGSK
jgi:raffinose/stachyose/melibiose transport system substrate-binding protein